MKDYIKIGLVGFAGYLIGFYECKYKFTKVMLEGMLEKEEKSKKEDETQ